MSLHVKTTDDPRILSDQALGAVRDALGEQSSCVLLVPSFELATRARRQLADAGEAGLGLAVSTPLAWASSLWEVWGDGRSLVDSPTRDALVRRAVRATPKALREGIDPVPGTVHVLGRLASDGLPWLPLADDGEPDADVVSAAGLIEGEVAAVRIVGTYRHLLHGAGLVESSEVCAQLPGILEAEPVTVPPVVVSGFTTLPRRTRELLYGLATSTEVTVTLWDTDTPATLESRATATLLTNETLRTPITPAGVETLATTDIPTQEMALLGLEGQCSSAVPQQRNALRGLSEHGVKGGNASPVIDPELLLPAGPVAEPEAIAERIARLAEEGATDIVVVSPDAATTWRTLAPKLAARGISVRAAMSQNVAEVPAGRAFMAYLQAVADLNERALVWPERKQGQDGELVRLGDMSWWPPAPIIDFLISDLAALEPGRAWSLDRTWRANRLLSPADVLDVLQNPGKTSQPVARATTELLLGHVGAAARRLMPALDAREEHPDDGLFALRLEEARGVLEATYLVASALARLGVTTSPMAQDAVSLPALVDEVCEGLRSTACRLRPAVDLDGATCTVRIMGANDAAALDPASVDAVVACGLTVLESPIERTDDVLSELMEALGVDGHRDGIAAARARFSRMLLVPRHDLVLERCSFDADAKETFPAVMLSEYLADLEAAGHEVEEPEARDEGLLGQNLSPAGVDPAVVATDAPAPAGQITGAARACVLVPPPGQDVLPEGKPLLSASQIETYLECPYKWFSLRRLRLEGIDAGFSNLEMGTFAHRVLERTRIRLLDEALMEADLRGEELPDLETAPQARVAGSAVTSENLERAHEVLDEEFLLHYEHQFLADPANPQAQQLLVPHYAYEVEDVQRMHLDLHTLLTYESLCLKGYEPRYFEWGFGGPKQDRVEYAGAFLNGKVDRIDVDAEGRALIIDYKHMAPGNFAKRYDAFVEGKPVEGLPRHVQSLIYAQVVRRRYPQVRLMGALFLATKGMHALAGAMAESQLDRVFGDIRITDARRGCVGITGRTGGAEEFWDYLDEVEALIAQKIEELKQGNIEARPAFEDSCSFCPVQHCERRRG